MLEFLASLFFIPVFMFFNKMRIKKVNRSVLQSSTKTLQMFWAYSHWIQMNFIFMGIKWNGNNDGYGVQPIQTENVLAVC